MREIVVRTEGLTRRFGARTAVDSVDLAVQRGEIFGLLGPNGAGKSTLLRMLLGLLEPSAGVGRVLGCAIPDQAEALRSRVGYMTQRFSLYAELSVQENLEFAGAIFGLPRARRRARIEEVLKESGLAEYRSARAANLSGGWQQRLALTAATLHEPELLVLDEPTAGVDPQSRRVFWERLFELAARGTTILVSTHYMDEAVRCHRIGMLRDGRRVAVGAPRELTRALGERVIEIETDEPERAALLLRELPIVVSSTQLGAVLHVLMASDAAAGEPAAAALRDYLEGRQLPYSRVSPCAASLEDAFVALLLGERLELGASADA